LRYHHDKGEASRPTNYTVEVCQYIFGIGIAGAKADAHFVRNFFRKPKDKRA
jgi:hypothetical protein